MCILHTHTHCTHSSTQTPDLGAFHQTSGAAGARAPLLLNEAQRWLLVDLKGGVQREERENGLKLTWSGGIVCFSCCRTLKRERGTSSGLDLRESYMMQTFQRNIPLQEVGFVEDEAHITTNIRWNTKKQVRNRAPDRPNRTLRGGKKSNWTSLCTSLFHLTVFHTKQRSISLNPTAVINTLRPSLSDAALLLSQVCRWWYLTLSGVPHHEFCHHSSPWRFDGKHTCRCSVWTSWWWQRLMETTHMQLIL